MNILLTGAGGFIGNHCIQYGLSHDIVPFSFQNGDIDTLNLSDCDAVIHLAALVHQMKGASEEAYFHVNAKKTLELAKKAKEAGVKQFIFMSTVKVYGEENKTPYTENSPCNPQDDYGKSKLAAEEALKAIEDENFIVSIIRTPVVYGPDVKGNIKSLIKLIKKVPILPFKAIKNQRSMVYVGNLCAMINAIIEQKKSGIFLASDDKNTSTTELIQTIATAMNKKIVLLNIPGFKPLLQVLKPVFYQRLYGNLTIDNTLTKNTLSFQNPYSFKEGIKQTITGSDHD